MKEGNQDHQITGHQTQEKKSTGSNRGFAAMDPEQQKEIARKGGKAAHQLGVAHQFSSEEAREAGRKGGEIVSQDRAHMARIGKKGGEASGGKRNKSKRTDSGEENS